MVRDLFKINEIFSLFFFHQIAATVYSLPFCAIKIITFNAKVRCIKAFMNN